MDMINLVALSTFIHPIYRFRRLPALNLLLNVAGAFTFAVTFFVE